MTLNRIFLLSMAVIGLVWIAAYIVDRSERAEDQAFYAREVAPLVQSGEGFSQGGPWEQWIQRTRRRTDNAILRSDLVIGGMALFLVWMMATVIKGELFWKKRNAPDRSADSNAGAAIAELKQAGGRLHARSGRKRFFLRSWPREVEIDALNETVIFRGFTFTAAFIGNRPTAQMTLRLDDILGGRIWMSHGQQSLHLRTTAGKVIITDAVQPFPELATVLLDAAEVNRSVPDRYLAALAREPRIKTPWYGWLLVALAVTALAGLAKLLWNLPTR